MTDPKMFTGPEGTVFTILDGGLVRIEGDDGSEYHTPIADLQAFCRAHRTLSFSLDGGRTYSAIGPAIAAEAQQARAEARRQAYVGSTAEAYTDAEGREFPTGTRVVAVGSATVAIEPARVYPPAECDHANTRHVATTNEIWCHDCASFITPRPGIDPGAGPGPDEPWNHWCSKPCGAEGCKGEGNRKHTGCAHHARDVGEPCRCQGFITYTPSSEGPMVCDRCGKVKAP